jgi:hypothetical protein
MLFFRFIETVNISKNSPSTFFFSHSYLISEISHWCSLPAAANPKDIEDEVAKEWEHTMLQDSMGKELNELNRQLEQKEVLDI